MKRLLISLICSVLLGCPPPAAPSPIAQRNQLTVSLLRNAGIANSYIVVDKHTFENALQNGMVVPGSVQLQDPNWNVKGLFGPANDVLMIYNQIFPPQMPEATH